MVTEQVNLPAAKAYPPTIKEIKKKKKRKKKVPFNLRSIQQTFQLVDHILKDKI